MKLVMAIVNADDAHAVINNLTQEGYSVTRLATTGGFLKTGNTTIIVGVEEEKVAPVLEIIKKHSHSRKQLVSTASELGMGFFPSVPTEITVGGATIFVMDVEQFAKF
ncbi:MAG: cyclic-di-AMP receptor [Oscillospiraceae bacterium]|nr:cyclic-di-AMP receptor [Oscillospiraceae bacterium]